MLNGIRTANRLWWMRRESSGERANTRSGTRQKSGRTFGIRPALSKDRVAAKDPSRLFIKNTGPC